MGRGVSAVAALGPLFPTVQVFLDGGRQDMLSLIDVTVAALERVGQEAAADAFSRLALTCVDDAELLDLINSTVTVI